MEQNLGIRNTGVNSGDRSTVSLVEASDSGIVYHMRTPTISINDDEADVIADTGASVHVVMNELPLEGPSCTSPKPMVIKTAMAGSRILPPTYRSNDKA